MRSNDLPERSSVTVLIWVSLSDSHRSLFSFLTVFSQTTSDTHAMSRLPIKLSGVAEGFVPFGRAFDAQFGTVTNCLSCPRRPPEPMARPLRPTPASTTGHTHSMDGSVVPGLSRTAGRESFAPKVLMYFRRSGSARPRPTPALPTAHPDACRFISRPKSRVILPCSPRHLPHRKPMSIGGRLTVNNRIQIFLSGCAPTRFPSGKKNKIRACRRKTGCRMVAAGSLESYRDADVVSSKRARSFPILRRTMSEKHEKFVGETGDTFVRPAARGGARGFRSRARCDLSSGR